MLEKTREQVINEARESQEEARKILSEFETIFKSVKDTVDGHTERLKRLRFIYERSQRLAELEIAGYDLQTENSELKEKIKSLSPEKEEE